MLAVGASRLASGDLSAGVLTAFLLYLAMFFTPVQQLSQVFDGYQQASIGLSRIAELLRTPTSVPPEPEGLPVAVPPRLRGEVELRNVTFAYAGADTPALDHVSLVVAPGETMALVGATGAGKSTLVKLLARFYDVSEGAVLVDGVDVRRFRLADFRHRLGVVPQEPHLFTGDVAANIAYARPDAPPAEIEAAARAVGALELVRGLPGGFHHPVGERGQGLSAGQRQLIALARAELADPRPAALRRGHRRARPGHRGRGARGGRPGHGPAHRLRRRPPAQHRRPRRPHRRAGRGADRGAGHARGAPRRGRGLRRALGGGRAGARGLVRRPQTFTGSSRAQTTTRSGAAFANTPGMSGALRLAVWITRSPRQRLWPPH